jgi:hypothetical protein
VLCDLSLPPSNVSIIGSYASVKPVQPFFFTTKIPLGGELIIDQLVGFFVVEGDIFLDLF